MPSSNLAAYLAKNYLTASASVSSHPGEPPKKKRKKSKHHPSTNGLVIADDDEDLSLLSSRHGAKDDEEADTPMMFEGKVRSAEFRKAKRNAWQPLPGSEATSNTTMPSNLIDEDNDDAADTFLRIAQSDEARRLAEQDAENAPAVVDMDINDDHTPRLDNGVRAGLQTAADTARLIADEEAREEAERRISKKSNKKKSSTNADGDASTTKEEETIYRDATGRRIDISLRRAEARREAAEKLQAQKQEKIDAMGEVQRQELETRRKDLDEAKFLTLGRSVEDEEYNERLKGQVRWDDPMAGYLAQRAGEEEDGDGGGAGRKAGRKGASGHEGSQKAAPRKKEYTGPAPPNRYGIKPGWRWDGVDRGNGFEKEWFQARSRRSRNDKLSYEWQMDE